MAIQQTEARRQSSRRMHIPTPANGVALAAAERARQVLADRNRFISWARDWVSCIPRTVVVSKGGKLPNLHLEYPVVVKPAKGHGLTKCETKSAMLKASMQMRGDAYQVQEYLTGFNFLLLSCKGGQVEVCNKQTLMKLSHEDRDFKTALRVSRRLLQIITSLGVKSFTLTVAVKHETAYITSCCPASGQMSQ